MVAALERQRLTTWVLLACLAVTVGCGGNSNLGQVTGKVTLNGQPLVGALVLYQPKNGGSPSAGTTDATGSYQLRYTRDEEGAEAGEHIVSISTFSSGNPDSDPPVPPVPEKVPARFNAKSELRANVQQGSNTLDFPLESIGLAAHPGGVSR